MLGLAYCVLGQRDKAIELYEEWLKDDPGQPGRRASARRVHRSRCSGAGRRMPCVQIIFDNFAASFESKLAHLQYRAPALVHMMLEESGPARRPRRWDVLDAGCGTGLCGPLVAPYARRLTGVDLSAGMLEQAKAKEIYDDLVQGELTAFLQGRPGAFDLIVSADTLVYFGDLEPKWPRRRVRRCAPEGLFVFTLEELVADDDGSRDAARAARPVYARAALRRAGAEGGRLQHGAVEHAELQDGIRVPGARTGDSRDRDQRRCPCLEAWRSRPRSATTSCCFTACTRVRS